MISPPLFLLAFANDRDDRVHYLRNLPEELRQITEALDRAKAQGLCDYIPLANATLKQILDTFQKAEYRNRIAVFHYGGHASSLQLLLETNDGRIATADASGLAAFLGQQRGLELVFLNGCSTQPQVEAFLDANVPMVVATSQAIDDEVAMEFASRFYRGLASGANVQSAYKEAEAAVRTTGNRVLRDLYWNGAQQAPANTQEDRWPWALYFKKGAETEGHWNLPETIGNPLFGLPIVPPDDLPAEPFRHLTWFTREHAEIFFGRNYQIRQLYDRLTEANGAPIVLLYGQAGVGKSSLLDAGLTPRMESSYEILYLRRHQERGLLGTIRQGLGLSKEEELSLSSAWLAREEQTGKPVALIVDQVEEVFTRPNSDPHSELRDFLQALEAAFAISQTRPRGRLILGFRKEWESEIEHQLKEYKLPHAKVFLQPLNSQGIIQAVTGITNSTRLQRQYGLIIEDGLPALMADDLSSDPESPIAPTLQILLTKMWAEAKRINNATPSFDLALYRQLKKEGLLLGDFLDQQLAKLKEAQPEVVNSGLALDVLAYHTTALGTAEQRTDSQIKQEYKHQLRVLSPLLERLKELYLIADPPQDQTDELSTKATRLAHDTLAPSVRARYDKSVLPGQRARRVLENRSPDWQGNNEGIPLDERDLAAVESGANGMREWTVSEKRLVSASRKLRSQRERRNRVLRIAAVAAIAAIILAAGVAWWQRSKANDAQQRSLSRQLLAEASLLRNTPSSNAFIQSILLNVEAQKRYPTSESNLELTAAFDLLPRQIVTSNLGGAVSALAFSADGKYLAVVQGNAVQVRDMVTGRGEPIDARLVIDTKWNCATSAFSSDGRYLAVGCGGASQQSSATGAAIVWDWRRNEQVKEIAFRSSVRTVSFVESRPIVLAVDELTAKLVDLQNAASTEVWNIQLKQDEEPEVVPIAVSSDGRILATGFGPKSRERSERVFDLVSRKQIYAEPEGDNLGESTVSLALSHDGKKLAIGRSFPVDIVRGDSLSIVDLIPRKEIVLALTGSASNLVFSPDSRYLAVFDSWQTTLRVLDSKGRDVVTQIDDSSISQNGDNAGVLFAPNSQLVILFSGDSAARFFRIPFSLETEKRPTAQELIRVAPGSPISLVALSADGQYFATGSRDGLFTLWATRTVLEQRDVVRVYIEDPHFTIDESNLQALSIQDECSFSPRGQYVIFNSHVTSTILDASDGHELIQAFENPFNIIFSKNDDYLSMSGGANAIIIRELATNREFHFAGDNDQVRDIARRSKQASLFVEMQGSLKEMDLNSGKVNVFMDLPNDGSAIISPDGQEVAITNANGVEIISTDSKKRTELDVNEKGRCSILTFDSNGKYLAGCGGGRTINVWETGTGHLVVSVPLPKDEDVQRAAIVFDGSGKQIALRFDNEIQITNLETKRSVSLASQSSAVAFSPDSTHLLALEKNTARLWRVPEGTDEGFIKGTYDIQDVRFSADGKQLLLLETEDYQFSNPLGPGKAIKSIHVRSILLDPTQIMENLCQWVPRNLTQEEWRKHLPSIPFTKTCPSLP